MPESDLQPAMVVGFRGKELSGEAKAELRAFRTVAVQHFLASPDARLLIVSEGPQPEASMANAQMVRDYLAANGVTPSRIDIRASGEKTRSARARITISR